MDKEFLITKTDEELKEIFSSLGEKPFRADQLRKWMYSLAEIGDMTNFSAALREKLSEKYETGYPKIMETFISKDGTRKYLLKLFDGSIVEAVLMRYSYGNTLCISTQVGCPMACRFCASGLNGLERQMYSLELVTQVLLINKELGGDRAITNIVLMGTGEPFLNYDNVVAFLREIHKQDALGISYRNISLSTCGIRDNILRFADEDIPLTLCLSLHSAINEKRRSIMPVEERIPLQDAVRAMEHYQKKTGRRIVYEYIMIGGLNIGDEDIDALYRLVKGQTAHINLIPLNGNVGNFREPTKNEIKYFYDRLKDLGLSVTIRRSLGQDIEGACGQLRARFLKDETGRA